MDPQKNEEIPQWKIIAEAGGIDRWVKAELRARKLLDENADTSRMNKKQLQAFKERREEERKVRKVLRKKAWASYKTAHLVHVGTGIFYHDTPDIDRFDIEDPEARRKENELPELKDAQAVAEALALSMGHLRWLVYQRDVDNGTHYHRWTVPKRDGSPRLISAPRGNLKKTQRWIARNITEHLPVHGAAHGFLAGRSTVTNAEPHAGAQTVIKLDLENFYPTVTLPRVKGMFRKAGYGEQTATVLALLCTDSPREAMTLKGQLQYVAVGPRSLPQGAPTSPSITNAISFKLDARLTGLAQSLGLVYTRYADDLTFSWHKAEEAPIKKLLGAVNAIVESEGFVVHRKKTRVLRAGRRQRITGLVVNSAGAEHAKARVPRTFVRALRAAIKNRELGKEGKGESLSQLKGMAAYVYMTNPKRGQEFFDRLAKLEAQGD